MSAGLLSSSANIDDTPGAGIIEYVAKAVYQKTFGSDCVLTLTLC